MTEKQNESQEKKNEELFIRILTFFSGGERYFTPDMDLNDVITEEFDEGVFILSILALQISLDVDIPDEYLEMARMTGGTISEFIQGLEKMPRTQDDLFPARVIKLVAEIYDQLVNNLLEEIEEEN